MLGKTRMKEKKKERKREEVKKYRKYGIRKLITLTINDTT
jgi:hypothetical protein